jgi:type 1 glutamine amidotransferase
MFSYHQNTPVRCVIRDDRHPVTRGLRDFDIVDETYIIGEPDQPGNEILITAECAVGIKNIGWARTYKNSRVVVTASGHDNQVYADTNYRRLIHNAILWTGA